MSFRYHICITAGLMATVIGCGQPNAKFAVSGRTKALVKEARRGTKVQVDGKTIELKGVEGYIEENFGTPHDLVAWLRLPIDFGGQPGTVAGQLGAKLWKVNVTDGTSIDGVASLAWLSGDNAGETIQLAKFDSEEGVVELSEKATAPPEGTAFIINPGATLAEGRQNYMTHCAHCHGTAGDGNGPTAEYLYPRPRDYRKGLFKFTRTKAAEKVTSGDLERIVKMGIPGTYMPSFMLLNEKELHSIVEYVRFLSMRGEYENKLCVELEESYSTQAIKDRTSKDGGETTAGVMKELQEFLASDFPELANDAGTSLAEAWTRAESDESLIVPSLARTPDSDESRARGRQLFLSAKAKCTNCHGTNGLGNGPQTEDYETDLATKQPKPLPGLYDEWGNIVKPRNLTSGIYRGGRRPIDLFCRIYAGIKGAKMPAFGGGVLKDEEIWDIVNYVLSIPYEQAVAAANADEKPATKTEETPADEPEKVEATSSEAAGE